jgi:hypothetical protein
MLVPTFTRGREPTNIVEIQVLSLDSLATRRLVTRLGGARQMMAISLIQ